MSVSVTFTGESQADLAKAAAAFFGGVAAAVVEDAAASGKAGRKAKATEEDKKPADDGPDYTPDQIRELAATIESDEDQDKAIDLVNEAGAESISDLAKKSAAVRVKVYEGIKAILAAKGGKKRRALD